MPYRLVLALQRSPAPGVCQKRWEMRWPPRAGMRTRYNGPLRRLTRPDVMRAHDSFRPSPGRSPRTSPDSFSRVGPVETIKEEDRVRTIDLLDDSAVSPHPEADEMPA